jgi:hypothetical protein
MLFNIVRNLKEIDLLGKVHVGGIMRELRMLTQQSNKNRVDDLATTAALNGDIAVVKVSGDMTLSAAALNAAAEGTVKKYLVIGLKTSKGVFHNWAAFQPVVTTAEVVTDAEVDAPTVEETDPAFVAGRMALTLVLDTDEGATKEYVEDDEVSVTVKVAADDKILGYTVAPLVLTFTVTA